MPTVEVSARRLEWPERCACCLGAAEVWLDLPAPRRGDRREQAPYCWRCKRHQELSARAEQSAADAHYGHIHIVVYALLCVACVGAGMMLSLTPLGPLLGLPPDTPLLAWLVAIALVVAIGVQTRRWWRSARDAAADRDELAELLRRECCMEGRAVRHLSRDGSVHVFDFASRSYADLFCRANGPGR